MSFRIRVGLLAAAVATLTTGLFAAEAGAIKYVHHNSGAGPGTQGAVSAQCPGQQQVLGGGVFSSGLFQDSWINSTEPSGDDSWLAFVDAPLAVDITAYAVCADGVQLKYKSSFRNVPDNKTGHDTAHCPSGYLATGGGVSNGGQYNEADVKSTIPVDNGTAWFAKIDNFSGSSLAMSTYVICAKGGFADDLLIKTKAANAGNGQQVTRSANCPNGSKVVGGGTDITRRSSNLNTTQPISDGSGWVSSVDGLSNATHFTTYAICHK